MTVSLTDYLKLKILDHVFGNTVYTAPDTFYVALYTTPPTDGGTEVTGGNYARVAIANNTANFPAASDGSKSNGTIITFPTATASWGTVVGFAILDADGNMLCWDDLTDDEFVDDGDTASFAVDALKIMLD